MQPGWDAASAPAAAALMLEHEEVITYLLERGLLESADIVDSGVSVVGDDRRNHNYHVHVGSGCSLLLKEGAHAGFGPGTVANEHVILEQLRSLPDADELKRRLPQPVCFDPHRGILALKLVTDARDLRSLQMSRRRASTRVARMIGETLGLLHAVGRGAPQHRMLSALPRAVPDVFGLTCPDVGVLHGTASAARAYIAAVQSVRALSEPLDALASQWRGETVIHGDPRWDNWLSIPSGCRARPGLMLVDWEFACVGDPAWDVGSALGEYLGAWVLSIPALPGATLDQSLALSSFPLDRLVPAMRALWHGYLSNSQAGTTCELLLAVRFAAAKLIQVGCEQMCHATAVTPAGGALLQLAANMFSDPSGAAVNLLGLAPVGLSAAESLAT